MHTLASDSPLASAPLDLYLKKGKDRAVYNRHPWLYSGAFQANQARPQPGQLCRIRSVKGEALALGQATGGGALAVRLVAFGSELPSLATDSGLDAAFWIRRFQEALAHRRRWVDTGPEAGYRLINAEGDRLPGLVVDVYAQTAVVQARSPGMQLLAPLLENWLLQEAGIKQVVVQQEALRDKQEKSTAAEAATGKAPPTEPREMLEHGLRYQLWPGWGQKTGFFLDQRDNRQQVRAFASGRRVLNLFSYSGGFALNALAGGAEAATSVDSSAEALQQAEVNTQLNAQQLNPQRHTCQQADAFDYLRQIEPGQFDLMILDPPAFTKHIRTVERAARGYKDLNLRALKLLPQGGLLFTYSCSQHVDRHLFRQILFAAAADAQRPVQLLDQRGHALDHPVDLFHPEGEYLKGLVLQVG